MTSIITGDIIHSQKVSPDLWLNRLKLELNSIGNNPQVWEIYRGDSFQVEIPTPTNALKSAIKIKAALKSIKHIDVKMAIGLGEKSHITSKITESNGSAFVFSGELFEHLVKTKINLAIASSFEEFNKDVNLMLRLALIVMDNWTVNSSEMVYMALKNPGTSQKELGKILGIKQNAVSNRLKRASYNEITELIIRYEDKIKNLQHDIN